MNWLVIWAAAAFGETQALLAAYPDRRAEFDLAFAEMAAALQGDPLDAGESRDADRRGAFYGPFGVNFRVDPVARRVYILRIYLKTRLR